MIFYIEKDQIKIFNDNAKGEINKHLTNFMINRYFLIILAFLHSLHFSIVLKIDFGGSRV